MQLEHIIRAAGKIADDDELIIIGSQAILGQYPDAPKGVLVSTEVDLFPKNKPEMADAIDAAIGSLSQFEAEFGYYAHGVGKDTARLPLGWETRLVPIKNENTRGVTGWCLDAHDLVLSKYAAGRPKDFAFCDEVIAHGLVVRERLLELVPQMNLVEPAAERILQFIKRAPWQRDRDRNDLGGGRVE